MKSNDTPEKIRDKSTTKSVSEKEFPKPICLEECEISELKKIIHTHGFDILNTLKSFSDKDKYLSKTPHGIDNKGKVKKYFKLNKKIMSLDVKGRHDTKRLLYFVENGVCKIVHLCTDETHT